VNEETIRKIAKLARLELSNEELPRIAAQLKTLMNHFSRLAEVKADGVKPMFHALSAMSHRNDADAESLPVASLEKNAPDFLEGEFRIPRVLQNEEEG
jgi:aspartyl-tRNA(Asn)/glutamyl-tRNA(Gln) amidotransferase subunit C